MAGDSVAGGSGSGEPSRLRKLISRGGRVRHPLQDPANPDPINPPISKGGTIVALLLAAGILTSILGMVIISFGGGPIVLYVGR